MGMLCPARACASASGTLAVTGTAGGLGAQSSWPCYRSLTPLEGRWLERDQGSEFQKRGDTPAPEPPGMGLPRGLTWVRLQSQGSTAQLQSPRAPGFSSHPTGTTAEPQTTPFRAKLSASPSPPSAELRPSQLTFLTGEGKKNPSKQLICLLCDSSLLPSLPCFKSTVLGVYYGYQGGR